MSSKSSLDSNSILRQILAMLLMLDSLLFFVIGAVMSRSLVKTLKKYEDFVNSLFWNN